MAAPGVDASAGRIPVLLLKTRSSPSDAYEELFSSRHNGLHFEPIFVPVLEHKFRDTEMKLVAGLLQRGEMGKGPECTYGGMVFTSQRAVEAFAKLVRETPADAPCRHALAEVPVYSVGPATTRALRAVMQEPSLQIFGEETGNGEALAPFIMQHYGQWYEDRVPKPPLLFLVGEQRRDVIPRTLMSESLPELDRIRVDETVIYGTGVMESFKDDFEQALSATRDRSMRWVVVFSPTGCDSMLQRMGLLDSATGEARSRRAQGLESTLIAAIGPTTRKHLHSFGFEPEVCAEQPSPEGVWNGITRHMAGLEAHGAE
ncbi:uncharacterized protein E0L32_009217 [Thyridium curvatum]|uniref:Tetrapyrrole biosynthesis uroporphyrinogen III synthase domain-containing protein n=1 Tax=Thyridium curvatum TaxID=1093900 RepID=A0A507ASE2_9PEZI|nr:uncharacterized protein E0L32_009217 [Thyridium curvatum]TPX09616.1 hypothetical protein E0L32_009217 [Thyridium curvatum]